MRSSENRQYFVKAPDKINRTISYKKLVMNCLQEILKRLALTTAAVWLVVSCATNTGGDGADVADEAVAAASEDVDVDAPASTDDLGDLGKKGDDLGDLGDLGEVDAGKDIAAQATPTSDNLEAGLTGVDEALTTEVDKGAPSPAPSTKSATEDLAAVDDSVLLSPDSAELGAGTPPATDPKATTDSVGSDLENLTSPAANDAATAANAAAAAAALTTPEPPAPPADETPSEPAAPRNRYASSRVPTIPGGAISKRGANLNRFYFVRKGDTPASVAQLIYGSSEQKNDLVAWNGADWKPGKLLFYNSPSNGTDKEMRSFYQERNVQPEEYQPKSGDWLSKIASTKLGSPLSWKEIAVVNGMSSPDDLEPGSRLAIYPMDLSSYGFQAAQQQVAEAKNPEPAPTQPPVAQATPPQPAETPAQATAPTDPATPPTTAENSEENPFEKKPKGGGGLDVGRLIDQNLLFVVMGGGVLLLALLLYLVAGQSKKKKKGGLNDDFGDEAFNSPKSKRK